MKTMKIIDLLNKMASNENYKPTFLFRGSIYKYNAETKYYEPSFMGLYKIFMILNAEVEIIEDRPSKIDLLDIRNNGKHLISKEGIKCNLTRSNQMMFKHINKLTEVVNYLLEKSDSNV